MGVYFAQQSLISLAGFWLKAAWSAAGLVFFSCEAGRKSTK